MRYGLRTLLIVLALGPPLLAFTVVNSNPGPSIAIALILYWSYNVAVAVRANLTGRV
ncbi:MAG TPA: hypothetical protein VGI40_28445 [Pirellulaceae bacterium]|jgi:hypothetical protein